MWKPIGGTGYSVSSMGRVRNDRTGRLLRPMMVGRVGSKRGKVLLCYDGRQEGRMVSHLVAEAFLGPRPEGMLVLHKNDNAEDNRARNLRYGTQKQNVSDAFKNGKRKRLDRISRAAIKRRRAAGERGRDLAREFGVSEQYVCDIHNGRK